MSLLNLGGGAFLLGLAVLAGVLFLLQRLRVKFSEREVVTTLFWKQAVEETRARILLRRFRHPLAYLLALAITGLIWLAIAEPRWNRSGESETVFLLDGSAGMAWSDRFEQAKVLLNKEAGRVPAAHRRIYFCGADARLVLDRGEELRLLGPRLAGLVPEPCPASIEREVFAMVNDEAPGSGLDLFIVGDAPIDPIRLSSLPDGFTLQRLRAEDAPVLGENTGISSIGVAAAVSGTFDRVDVRVEVRGGEAGGMSITLGGRALDQDPIGEQGVYFLRDLPAGGDVLEINLAGEEALTMDNRARITLPARRTVTVRLDANLDDRFQALVDADPALVATAVQGEVVIGGAADGSLPAIELVTGNGIAVIHEPGLLPRKREQLETLFGGLGLDRVGRNLVTGGEGGDGFRLSPRLVPGAERRVQIGIELMSDDYDFVRSSAFPLFVSTALRWLAGVDAIEPFAAAGEHTVQAGTFRLAGSDYAPPRAGSYTRGEGRAVEVALPAVRASVSDTLKQISRIPATGPWTGLVTGCILLALALVGGEWWLFQKGRIP